MTRDRCYDLCQQVPIRTHGELRRVIGVARANVEDGTIVEIINGQESTPLSTSGPNTSLPDVIRSELKCRDCREVFLLRCEAFVAALLRVSRVPQVQKMRVTAV